MRFATLLALAALAPACARETPSTPLAPPDVGAPPPPAPGVSRFSMPIAYDFSPVLRTVEQIVPCTSGRLDSVRAVPNDDRRHYAFEATRGPFTAFADGNQLHLRTTLTYAARGYLKPVIGPTVSAGCGKGQERPRIVVEVATPISLSPGWHLTSKARLVTVEPASTEPRDHCDVTFLHRDVTPQVVEAARSALTGQLAGIDARISTVDLTSHATGWWRMLARPIKLSDDVWLTIGPERLRLGRVRGHERTYRLCR